MDKKLPAQSWVVKTAPPADTQGRRAVAPDFALNVCVTHAWKGAGRGHYFYPFLREKRKWSGKQAF